MVNFLISGYNLKKDLVEVSASTVPVFFFDITSTPE